jgi:hypothetical protein
MLELHSAVDYVQVYSDPVLPLREAPILARLCRRLLSLAAAHRQFRDLRRCMPFVDALFVKRCCLQFATAPADTLRRGLAEVAARWNTSEINADASFNALRQALKADISALKDKVVYDLDVSHAFQNCMPATPNLPIETTHKRAVYTEERIEEEVFALKALSSSSALFTSRSYSRSCCLHVSAQSLWPLFTAFVKYTPFRAASSLMHLIRNSSSSSPSRGRAISSLYSSSSDPCGPSILSSC